MKKIIPYSYCFCIFLLDYGCGTHHKIAFIQQEDQIDVMAGDRLITSYLYGHHLSKPILYPVMSPSGEIVTRSFPFKEIAGESNDHPHHTGVSFTYGSNGEVNGNSFWANVHDKPPLTMDKKLPQIRHKEMLEMKAGKDKGILSTVNQWIDRNNKPVLKNPG